MQEGALTEIAQSAAVAEAVAQAQPELLSEEQSSASLLSAIEVNIKGDLLVLTASAGDSERVAVLANAWMEAMNQHLDEVYSLSPETVAEIEKRRAIAKQEYEAAQLKLETFLETSQLAGLQSQLRMLRDLLGKYETSLAQSAASYYTERLDEQQQRLSSLYAEETRIRQKLLDAQSLAKQVNELTGSRTESWGLVLAFINLQAEAYGGVPQGLLQLDLGGAVPTVKFTEVAELIVSLENKLTEIQRESATLSQQLGDVESVRPDATEESVLEQQVKILTSEAANLEGQIEQQFALKNELTAARDVAWTTYKSLLDKLHELQVENSISASQARVAFRALPPSQPTAPRRLMNTALAGVVGLMLAVGSVLIIEYLAPERYRREGPEVKGLLGWLLAESSGLSWLDFNGNGSHTDDIEEVVEKPAHSN